VTVKALLLPVCLVIGTVANAAPDPAELYLSKVLIGDTVAATKLLIEPILQDARTPLFPAKAQITAVEFMGAVKDCSLQTVQNSAPSSLYRKVSPDFFVVWHCGFSGIKAQVRASAEGKVLVMNPGKAVFAPPAPPTEFMQAKPDNEGKK
jgi:hypothetical protein